MTAAHFQNYHSPEAHNARLAIMISRKNRRLAAAKAEHLWLCDVEADGIKLSLADSDKCSSLFFEIRELAAEISDLETLELPLEN
jgi:hypothetical protein